ncbi:MAG: MBL fold metallo-hydrolase [Rhodobiaceae bacterium]|jgi:ribonuclease Z|nr:MBL fold metallo-hydrolase [Rhodobiaceae bacterium]
MPSKILRIGAVTLTGGIVLALGFALVMMNSVTLQDRLVERALTARLSQTPTNLGGDGIDVVFCGTASPMGQGSAQSCVAVFAGDRFFLVDTGARSADMATRLGLPMGRLSGVLLTHFHSDHIAALGEMHLASWVRGRPQKLDVYGGPGVAQVVDGFNMAYGLDYGYRTAHHTQAIMPSKTAGLVAKTIKGDRVIYNADGLKITAVTVNHPPIEPAYGYRFDYQGRSVLISGDTTKDGNLIAAAKGVDVLIHEVLQDELVKATSKALVAAGQENLGQLIEDTLDYHTTPVEAAEAANEAGAQWLVFYHYAPVPQNALLKRIFLRGVDTVRPEGVLAASDGTRISLKGNSQSLEVTP